MRTLGWLLLVVALLFAFVSLLHVGGALSVTPLSRETMKIIIPGVLLVALFAIPGLLLVVLGKQRR